MNLYHAALEVLRMFLLLAGSVVIFVGIVRAALEALWVRTGRLAARQILAQTALGLEFFVGATILNLILNPTWTAVQTTALTIVVRQLITLSFARSTREG
jgi:uncharacterized membrane protein